MPPKTKPTNRRRFPADLSSLARSHTVLGVQVLAGIAQHSENDSARVAAVALLFDRGWGKVSQPVSADGSLEIVIRQIVEHPSEHAKLVNGGSHVIDAETD
jgi:hypothetical protein